MRIAVISDIHGNLVALDAVLDDISSLAIDDLVSLGDVALRGPQPYECLQRLRELDCPMVIGNTDEWLIDEKPSWRIPDDRDPVMEIDLWCAELLTADDREYLRGFQPTIEMPLSQGDTICLFHGSPRANTDNILSITPEADLEAMIAGCDATVLVGGHTHLQMLRRKHEKTIVNVGSVGLPFLVDRVDMPGRRHVPVAPWAEYAVIEYERGRLSVDLRRVPINVDALERAAIHSGMPYARWWIDQRDRRLVGEQSNT